MSIDSQAGDRADPRYISEWLIEQMRRRAEAAALVRTSELHRGLSQCHHCGAHIRWTAVLKHLPTGTHIAVGEQCLDNRFEQATAEFHRLRKVAELDREKMRIRTAVAAFVDANPDLAFMADPNHVDTNDFRADVARKLRAYGELSERQVEAVRRSITRDAEWATKKAAEAAQPQAPVVTGRIVVTGEVLSTKFVDGHWGSCVKMLVRDDRGFKVWGTRPQSLEPRTEWDAEGQLAVAGAERGDRVRFTATVEASHDDPSFGFFKRPARAELLARGGE